MPGKKMKKPMKKKAKKMKKAKKAKDSNDMRSVLKAPPKKDDPPADPGAIE